jgi:hypothetical protein
MRAYNIPDVDLLEAIYGRTTAWMDPEDPKCAIMTFLTGVIQGGASSPRIFIVFINALLEHLTHTGKALGISHGIEETDQFNHVAFMDDITVVAQDNLGSQILMDAVQEFEIWKNNKLNMIKTVVMSIDGFGDFQWKSPFDTCPATMSPLSLTNLQVAIGGQNVLNSTLNMTYENFLQQVNLAEQLTSSDFGVSTGLISQGYWEMSK